jgi:serine/threonine protein kinase
MADGPLPLLGTILESKGYELVKEIGRGASASCYAVLSRQYHEIFCVKAMALEKAQTCSDCELNALRQLSCPSIIYLYDFVSTPSHLFLFLEFCPGGSIIEVIRRTGPLKGQLLYAVAKAILVGLAYIHGRRFAHLDIKPANILVDRFGRPKLADFGISRGFSQEQASSQRAGTLGFIAPEMFWSSRTYDPFKADVWALGITFFFLATGSSPWASRHQDQLRVEILDGVVVCPPEVPRRFMALIRAMCDRDPATRATAAECLEMPIFEGIDVKDAKLPIGRHIAKGGSGQGTRAHLPMLGGPKLVVPKTRDPAKIKATSPAR